MPLRAGKLDRRIVLQRKITVPDSTGQMLESWYEIAGVWATVERPRAGREAFGQDQRFARQPVTFTIRYRAGLAPGTCRVKFDGELYDVEDVAELSRREGLVLTAYAHEVQSGP